MRVVRSLACALLLLHSGIRSQLVVSVDQRWQQRRCLNGEANPAKQHAKEQNK